jgi:hypothetical protein
MSLPRFHVSYWSLADVRTTKWRVYNWISTKFSKSVFALYGPLHRKWLNWFILFITWFHNLMIIATTLDYRHTLIAMWCLYYRTNIMPLLLIGSVSYTHLYCLINARRSDLACGKELKHILVLLLAQNVPESIDSSGWSIYQHRVVTCTKISSLGMKTQK